MILIPVVLFLAITLVLSRKVKGPLWALAIAWLVSVLPVATGMLTFSYLEDRGYAYSFTLIAYIGSFVVGCTTFYVVPRVSHSSSLSDATPVSINRTLRRVWFCWWLGMIGALCVVLDFYLNGGVGLNDLATLRDAYVGKTSASIYSQLGSVLTWACLYCFIFVLMFRQQLRPLRLIILLMPIGGYFLISLLSAGRQAAFQVMLVTLLTIATTAARSRLRHVPASLTPQPKTQSAGSKVLIAVVSAAMISYMGYIAVARNDNLISDDKTEVLISLFSFHLSPLVEAIGSVFGNNIRAVLVEALIYFSGSIGIFQQYLTIHFPIHSYGAMTVPFFFRQIQSFTGVLPSDVAMLRIDSLNAIGMIGAGWSTAISSYLIDFGPVFTGLFLLVMGYYSAYAWRRALISNRFEDIVIGIIVLLSAIYMPLIPAISDNNILFLWIFSLVITAMRRRYPTPAKSFSSQ